MTAKKLETSNERDGQGLLMLKYNAHANPTGKPYQPPKPIFTDTSETLSRLTRSGFYC